MENTETLQHRTHQSEWELIEGRRVIDRAFFNASLNAGVFEQSGIRVDARLVERDKAFLGNRLKISA